MLSILDAQTSLLSRTKTYARRHMYWAPCTSYVHASVTTRDATVMIHQQAEKSGSKRDEDQYAVEYAGELPGAMGYQFTFENLDPKPGEPKVGPYAVTVGPNLDHCTCTAGDCHVEVCKHRSSVYRAIFLGLVEGVTPWAGMPECHEEVRLIADGEVWGAEPEEPEWDESEASGLWYLDSPGEPTRAELDEQARSLGWLKDTPSRGDILTELHDSFAEACL